MTFEHYIITRFNLPIFQAKVAGKESTSCSKEYLQYRFELFEKYCMPSIMNQTCQNFKWLVLFDINTPEEFKQRINELHNKYPNLTPCFLDTNKYCEVPEEYNKLCDNYTETIKKHYPTKNYDLKNDDMGLRKITPLFIKDCIKQCSNSIPDYYITTRIDNDDAFHKDMIQIIQDKVKREKRIKVYDFVYSYKYILNEGIVYRYPLHNGHFITLVESTKQLFHSVIFWNHIYIDKFIPKVEHIYQEPLQTELIHGNNVVNDFTEISIRGMLYALFHFKKNNFGYRRIYLSPKRTLRIIAFLIKQNILSYL